MKKKQIIIQMINTYLFTKFKFNEKKSMREIVIENPFARDKLCIKKFSKTNKMKYIQEKMTKLTVREIHATTTTTSKN